MPLPVLRAARAALATLVASGLVLAMPALATADDSTTWGVRTGSTDHGSDRENFSYVIDPGERIDDVLVVANHGDAPLDLDVYAADGYTTDAGHVDVLTREETSSEVGAWLSPDFGSVHIEPGAAAEVPFAVTVPADATPGDYVGAILTSRTQSEQSADVETRLGVRVFVRVAGDLAPSLAITDARLDYHDQLNPFAAGRATVTYTVRNTGNVRLAAGQKIRVAGPFGWFGRDASAEDVPELLPGETWRVSVPVDGVVPAFRVSARIVLAAEPPTVAGETPTVAPIEAEVSALAVPWTALALLVLVVGVAWYGIKRRRTRARREDERFAAALAAALRERDQADAASRAAADGTPRNDSAEALE